MKRKAYILLAEGFEEVEAMTPVDLLRRAGVQVDTVAVSENDSAKIVGARGIPVTTDLLLKYVSETGDMLILPGGQPGVRNLGADPDAADLIRQYAAEGKYIAAICAAPTILGKMGLLQGKKATCYPGLEKELKGASWPGEDVPVVQDGNIITSRGVGTAIPFALKLIEILQGKETAAEIASQVVYREYQA